MLYLAGKEGWRRFYVVDSRLIRVKAVLKCVGGAFLDAPSNFRQGLTIDADCLATGHIATSSSSTVSTAQSQEIHISPLRSKS